MSRSAHLFLPCLLSVALASCAGESGPAEPSYKHVLLVSLDTTRADQIGCYGGNVSKTPRIDAIAAEGVVFEEMMSAASSTLASHTSMMTGLYPRQHGVARNGFMVNNENVMLAEVLRDEGFHTAGFIASFALDQEFDFDQGFAFWDQEFGLNPGAGRTQMNQRRADKVTDAVLRHLDELDGGERLFLFAHYFDSHSPYDPPEPFNTEYAVPGGMTTSTLGDLGKQITKHQELVNGKKRPVYDFGLSLELAQYAKAEKLPGDDDFKGLYNGELAYLDRELGRLFDGLEERELLRDTIVVITGDHGETFWEHGDFWHHGAWVYQTNVHVPFIVRLPGGEGAGRRIAEPVSGVDVYPMLLKLLDIPLPEPVAGIGLAAVFKGNTPPAQRPLFSEATQPSRRPPGQYTWENQQKARCVRIGRWKMIETPYLKYRELYDLEADPGERKNLLLDPNPKLAQVMKGLSQAMGSWSQQENGRASAFKSTQMQNVQKRLQGLGYVGDLEDADGE